jgi:hypothetical protein
MTQPIEPTVPPPGMGAINVGCWAGRVVLDCTLCDWQDPAVYDLTAQECRRLDRLVTIATEHLAEHGRTATAILQAYASGEYR